MNCPLPTLVCVFNLFYGVLLRDVTLPFMSLFGLVQQASRGNRLRPAGANDPLSFHRQVVSTA